MKRLLALLLLLAAASAYARNITEKDPKDYIARSPITYIDRVKMPLMLILGEADYRTPPMSGGEMMFRASGTATSRR